MKSIFSILFTFVSLFALANGNDSLPSASKETERIVLVQNLIEEAVSHLGVTYCRGGSGFKCFDCSGFVSTVYNKFGIQLPHSSAAIATVGTKISKKQDIQPGDLIYFKGSNVNSKRVGHVGIVVQNDGNSIIFIHASINKGIMFTELETSAYYKSRYLGATRVIR